MRDLLSPKQVAQALGVGGFGAIEEQVRRNMEMFERTFSMFAPFARQGAAPAEEADKAPKTGGGDIDELKRQLDEMQKRVDRLSGTNKS